MSNPINPLTLRNITSRNSSTLPSWNTGQLLHATFLKKNDNGQSLLKVGSTLVQIKLPHNLKVGDKILLEIVKAGPKPVVRVYSNQAPVKTSQSVITDAIKMSIAKQNSATLLLNTIQLIQKQSPVYSSLPVSIRRLMKSLTSQAIPLPQISTAEGVKKALQNSGLLLERRLFTAPQTATNPNTSTLQQTLNLDFKATLLKLRQQLTLAIKPLDSTSTNSNPKLSLSNYQNLAKTTDSKLIDNKTFISSNITQTPLPLIDKAGITTSAAIQGLVNSTNTEVNNTSVYGYAIQSLAIIYNLQNLRPLLRNSSPNPAGSNKSFFSLTIDKLATHNQGLILQLLKMVESALARINIAQLSSASVETDNKQVWLFDIPLLKDDKKEHELVQARIDVDQETEDNNNRTWTVQLAMDLSALGPLQSTITIHDNKVQAHFKSSDPVQQKLIEEHMNILRDSLSHAGLIVEKLICTQGLQEQTNAEHIQPLLDEEA